MSQHNDASPSRWAAYASPERDVADELLRREKDKQARLRSSSEQLLRTSLQQHFALLRSGHDNHPPSSPGRGAFDIDASSPQRTPAPKRELDPVAATAKGLDELGRAVLNATALLAPPSAAKRSESAVHHSAASKVSEIGAAALPPFVQHLVHQLHELLVVVFDNQEQHMQHRRASQSRGNSPMPTPRAPESADAAPPPEYSASATTPRAPPAAASPSLRESAAHAGEVDKLRKGQRDLEERLAEANAHLHAALDQNALLEEETQRLARALEEAADDVQRSAHSHEAIVTELAAEIDQERIEARDAQAELERVEVEFAAATDELRRQLADAELAAETAEAVAQLAEEELATTREHMEALREGAAQSNAVAAPRDSATPAATAEELRTLESDIAALRDELRRCQADRRAVCDELRREKERAVAAAEAETKTHLASKADRAAAPTADAETAEAEIAEAPTRVEESPAAVWSLDAGDDAPVPSAEELLEGAQLRAAFAEDQLAAALADVDALRQDADAARLAEFELHQAAGTHEAELQCLASAAADAASSIAALEAQNDSLVRQLDEKAATFAELRDAAARASDREAAAVERARQCAADTADAAAREQAATERAADSAVVLKSLRAEAAAAQGRSLLLEKACREASEAAAHERKSAEALAARFEQSSNEAEATIKSLSDEIASAHEAARSGKREAVEARAAERKSAANNVKLTAEVSALRCDVTKLRMQSESREAQAIAVARHLEVLADLDPDTTVGTPVFRKALFDARRAAERLLDRVPASEAADLRAQPDNTPSEAGAMKSAMPASLSTIHDRATDDENAKLLAALEQERAARDAEREEQLADSSRLRKDLREARASAEQLTLDVAAAIEAAKRVQRSSDHTEAAAAGFVCRVLEQQLGAVAELEAMHRHTVKSAEVAERAQLALRLVHSLPSSVVAVQSWSRSTAVQLTAPNAQFTAAVIDAPVPTAALRAAQYCAWSTSQGTSRGHRSRSAAVRQAHLEITTLASDLATPLVEAAATEQGTLEAALVLLGLRSSAECAGRQDQAPAPSIAREAFLAVIGRHIDADGNVARQAGHNLSRRVAEAQRANDLAKAEIAALRLNMASASGARTGLQGQLARCESELQLSRQREAALRDAVSGMGSQIDNLQAAFEGAEAAQRQLSSWLRERSSQPDAVDVLREDVSAQRARSIEDAKHAAEGQSKMRTLEALRLAAADEASALRERLAATVGDLAVLEGKLQEREERVAAVQEALAARDLEIKQMHAHLSEAADLRQKVGRCFAALAVAANTTIDSLSLDETLRVRSEGAAIDTAAEDVSRVLGAAGVVGYQQGKRIATLNATIRAQESAADEASQQLADAEQRMDEYAETFKALEQLHLDAASSCGVRFASPRRNRAHDTSEASVGAHAALDCGRGVTLCGNVIAALEGLIHDLRGECARARAAQSQAPSPAKPPAASPSRKPDAQPTSSPATPPSVQAETTRLRQSLDHANHALSAMETAVREANLRADRSTNDAWTIVDVFARLDAASPTPQGAQRGAAASMAASGVYERLSSRMRALEARATAAEHLAAEVQAEMSKRVDPAATSDGRSASPPPMPEQRALEASAATACQVLSQLLHRPSAAPTDLVALSREAERAVRSAQSAAQDGKERMAMLATERDAAVQAHREHAHELRTVRDILRAGLPSGEDDEALVRAAGAVTMSQRTSMLLVEQRQRIASAKADASAALERVAALKAEVTQLQQHGSMVESPRRQAEASPARSELVERLRSKIGVLERANVRLEDQSHASSARFREMEATAGAVVERLVAAGVDVGAFSAAPGAVAMLHARVASATTAAQGATETMTDLATMLGVPSPAADVDGSVRSAVRSIVDSQHRAAAATQEERERAQALERHAEFLEQQLREAKRAKHAADNEVSTAVSALRRALPSEGSRAPGASLLALVSAAEAELERKCVGAPAGGEQAPGSPTAAMPTGSSEQVLRRVAVVLLPEDDDVASGAAPVDADRLVAAARANFRLRAAIAEAETAACEARAAQNRAVEEAAAAKDTLHAVTCVLARNSSSTASPLALAAEAMERCAEAVDANVRMAQAEATSARAASMLAAEVDTPEGEPMSVAEAAVAMIREGAETRRREQDALRSAADARRVADELNAIFKQVAAAVKLPAAPNGVVDVDLGNWVADGVDRYIATARNELAELASARNEALAHAAAIEAALQEVTRTLLARGRDEALLPSGTQFVAADPDAAKRLAAAAVAEANKAAADLAEAREDAANHSSSAASLTRSLGSVQRRLTHMVPDASLDAAGFSELSAETDIEALVTALLDACAHAFNALRDAAATSEEEINRRANDATGGATRARAETAKVSGVLAECIEKLRGTSVLLSEVTAACRVTRQPHSPRTPGVEDADALCQLSLDDLAVEARDACREIDAAAASLKDDVQGARSTLDASDRAIAECVSAIEGHAAGFDIELDDPAAALSGSPHNTSLTSDGSFSLTIPASNPPLAQRAQSHRRSLVDAFATALSVCKGLRALAALAQEGAAGTQGDAASAHARAAALLHVVEAYEEQNAAVIEALWDVHSTESPGVLHLRTRGAVDPEPPTPQLLKVAEATAHQVCRLRTLFDEREIGQLREDFARQQEYITQLEDAVDASAHAIEITVAPIAAAASSLAPASPRGRKRMEPAKTSAALAAPTAAAAARRRSGTMMVKSPRVVHVERGSQKDFVVMCPPRVPTLTGATQHIASALQRVEAERKAWMVQSQQLVAFVLESYGSLLAEASTAMSRENATVLKLRKAEKKAAKLTAELRTRDTDAILLERDVAELRRELEERNAALSKTRRLRAATNQPSPSGSLERRPTDLDSIASAKDDDAAP